MSTESDMDVHLRGLNREKTMTLAEFYAPTPTQEYQGKGRIGIYYTHYHYTAILI